MNRSIRYAAFIGSCLLGVACQQGTAPAESSFVPEAQYIPASEVPPLVTRVSGVAWDPEAFFESVAFCGMDCPIPPFLSEDTPLFQRSAVRGAQMLALDPLPPGGPTGAPAIANATGMWVLPSVPSRATAPFFILSTGEGALPSPADVPFPLPPVPPAPYLPTVTLRPIRTVYGICTSQDAVQMSNAGILEATALYLSAHGRSTVVADFLDPTKFSSVVVVGMYHAGNSALRAPAAGMSVAASFNNGTPNDPADDAHFEVYNIDWDPSPAPNPLKSTRGFVVTEAPTSPTGFAVVVVPATSPAPPVITYAFNDPVTDTEARRPWVFPPIDAPPSPGVIGFIVAQMRYAPGPIPIYSLPPPPAACVPQ